METAVEYLEEAIKISSKETFYDLVEVISIAKAMERKQIIDSIELAHKTDYNSDFTCKYTKEQIIDIILNNNKSEGKNI